MKYKNNNLTVFEPKLHICVRPKTNGIPGYAALRS